MGKVNEGFAPKPVLYTMQMLVDKIHDFTTVSRVNISSNPYTRVYKFDRQRGTSCYIAWSESNRHPGDPHVPNGETVAIPVISDSLVKTTIITGAGITHPDSSFVFSGSGFYSVQLGFEPIILEETESTVGIAETKTSALKIYPNPAQKEIHIELTGNKTFENAKLKVYDSNARLIYSAEKQSGKTITLNVATWARGQYKVVLETESGVVCEGVVVQ